MLVLTRKKNQSIVIGDNIIVTIGEIRGDSVKIAIEAPQDIKIFRSEVYDAIVQENKEALITNNENDWSVFDKIIQKSNKLK